MRPIFLFLVIYGRWSEQYPTEERNQSMAEIPDISISKLGGFTFLTFSSLSGVQHVGLSLSCDVMPMTT